MQRSIALIAAAMAWCLSALWAGEKPAPQGPVAREERSFDISFLTSDIPDFPLAARMRHASLGLHAPDEEWDERGGPGGLGFTFVEEDNPGDSYPHVPHVVGPADIVLSPAEMPRWTRIAPSALVETITCNIAEDSWANSRNSIAAAGEALVVRQTPDVLAQIDTFLRRLHEQRARMIVLEIAIVPAEALGENARTGAPWISSEEFGKIVAGADAQSARLTAYNGQTVSAHMGEQRSIVMDFDINQTGASPVANLVVSVIPLGLLVEARPRTIGETGWIDVNLRVVARSFRDEPEKRQAPFGEYESVWIAERTLATELILQEGAAAVAGFVEGSAEGVGSFAALVRAHPYAIAATQAAQEPAADLFVTRTYDIESILRAAGETGEPLARAPANPDDVVTLITHAIDPDSWKDRRAELHADAVQLVVRQKPAAHAKVAALLAQWTRETAHMTTIETWDLGGAGAAVNGFLAGAGPGGSLSESWRARAEALGLVVKAHTRTSSARGRTVEVSAMVSRAFIADWETVGGGTSYVITDYPDPIVRRAGSGIELSARAQALPFDTVMLDLDATRAEATFDRQAIFVAPWRLGRALNPFSPPGGGNDEEGEEEERPPPPRELSVSVPVPIELPRENIWKLRRTQFPSWNTPAVLEATAGKDGTARLLVARLSRADALK